MKKGCLVASRKDTTLTGKPVVIKQVTTVKWVKTVYGVELVRGLKGDMAGPSEMPTVRGLVGFQEVVSNTKISTWVSLGDFKPWCNVQMRVVFLWLRRVNMQFENIQGRVNWSTRLGHAKYSGWSESYFSEESLVLDRMVQYCKHEFLMLNSPS